MCPILCLCVFSIQQGRVQFLPLPCPVLAYHFTETITVLITVSNVGKSDFPGTVSLYYPNGKQVEDFGSPVLTAGSSINWSGTRTVTQEELDEGKIIFMFRYSAYDDEGKLQSYAVGITKRIQYSAPET